MSRGNLRAPSPSERQLTVQAGEGEHANLRSDVTPSVGADGGGLVLVFEEVEELLAHQDNALSHARNVLLPFGEELGVVEDERDLSGGSCVSSLCS